MPEKTPLDMREYLTAGLLADDTLPVNTPALVELTGLKSHPTGLKSHEEVTLVTTPEAVDPPLPQFFVGEDEGFLISQNGVYDFNNNPPSVGAQRVVYKLESAANPTLESVDEPEFDSATPWTLGAGWSIGGGELSALAVADGVSTDQVEGDQAITLVSGKRYRVTTVVNTVGTGGFQIQLGSAVALDNISLVYSAPGTYTEDLMGNGITMDLFIKAVGVTTGDIESINVKEIESETFSSPEDFWHWTDLREVMLVSRKNYTLIKAPYYTAGEFVRLSDVNNPIQVGPASKMGTRVAMSLFDDGTVFDPANQTVDSQRWDRLWKAWIATDPPYVVSRDMQMDFCTLLVSQPDAGDIDVPLMLELAVAGAFPKEETKADVEDEYIDAITKGLITFLPLPWQGELVAVRELGQGCVAYCTDGVSFVREVNGFIQQVPLKDQGPVHAGMVCGDENEHRFIDRDGLLWNIDADGTITKLGYDRYLEPLVGQAFGNALDPLERDYYFTTDSSSFVHGVNGLSKHHRQLVTSLYRYEDELHGTSLPLTPSPFVVETYDFDMELSVQKLVRQIVVTGREYTGMLISLKYLDDFKADESQFVQGADILPNERGIVFPRCAGRRFRIRITGDKVDESNFNEKIEQLQALFEIIERKNL